MFAGINSNYSEFDGIVDVLSAIVGVLISW
jgi:hypothetical protein